MWRHFVLFIWAQYSLACIGVYSICMEIIRNKVKVSFHIRFTVKIRATVLPMNIEFNQGFFAVNKWQCHFKNRRWKTLQNVQFFQGKRNIINFYGQDLIFCQRVTNLIYVIWALMWKNHEWKRSRLKTMNCEVRLHWNGSCRKRAMKSTSVPELWGWWWDSNH